MFHILLFTLSIYQELTNDTWNDFFNHSNSLGFVMCFHPSCGHCKREYPKFLNTSEQYSNDQRILFGTINCSSNFQLCMQLGIDGYPTFYTIFHNFYSEIFFNRHPQIYSLVADRLLNLDQKIYFKDQPINQYPHFEFTFQKNDDESIQNAERAISYSDIYNTASYHMKYGDTNQLIVQIDKDIQIPMNNDFDIENIANFLKEYQQPYFGLWNSRLLKTLHRPKIIFSSDIAQNATKVQQFKEYFKNSASKYSFHLTTQRDYAFNKQFHLEPSELPAAVFIGKNHSEYSKLTNIENEKQIEDFLNLDDSERHYYSMYSRDYLLFWDTMKIVIYIVIFVVLVIISLLVFFELSRKKSHKKKGT